MTTSSASANEGGFDENDRVSMRGTNPSLTQTLINGHTVAAGDWFVLNQVQQVGRSVSYTLLPSELVDQIVVHKSSQASLVEGGVAGSVDIITRKPLGFKRCTDVQRFGRRRLRRPAGRIRPAGERPLQLEERRRHVRRSAAGFLEERHLRRDGVEILGYETIAPGSASRRPNPDLAGVLYPER